MPYLLTAIAFLITVISSLVVLLLALRFLLQWNRRPYDDSLGINQFVFLTSQPLVRPFNRFIPKWRSMELSPPILMWAVEALSLFLIALLSGKALGLGTVLLLALANVIELIIYIYMIALFIQAIMSFVAPYHPAYRFISAFTLPVLAPLQKRVPSLNGFDFSLLIAIVLLQLALILIVAPLRGGF